MEGIHAQHEYRGTATPFKPQSPLFGKDIIINDSPTQNQRQLVLCSAFNGWLFAEYSYTDPNNHSPAATVMKSIDNGYTWSEFFNGVWPGVYTFFNSLDMIVTGDSISNLKVFLVYVVSNDPITGIGEGIIWRYNGETGVFEDGFQLEYLKNISLYTDFQYPANSSNPYSIGILYSAHSYTPNNQDSLIFLSSNNGGLSFNGRNIVSITDHIFSKAAITYGRSNLWNSGRYFATWQEQLYDNSKTGHIYTSHSEPDFNSPFTKPVCLDSIDPASINMGRNPSIACQMTNIDNDSSNLTELVLFDKFNTSTHLFDIMGYYNLQATNHNNFKILNISNSAHYNIQPSINFNHFDSTFMVTYYDSTTQKLPYLTNDFNLRNPDNWHFVSTGYNDSTSLSSPYPKVVLNQNQKKGANIWSAESIGGKGIGMFDSEYSTWTGISEIYKNDIDQSFYIYPNPCGYSLNLVFKLKEDESVKINIYNQLGEFAENVTNQKFPTGHNLIKYNTTNLAEGCYYLVFSSKNLNQTKKLFIVK